MKETAAKRRDRAGREREKPKEAAAPDVEMPEEEAAGAARPPAEVDSVTLDGNPPADGVNPPELPQRVSGGPREPAVAPVAGWKQQLRADFCPATTF